MIFHTHKSFPCQYNVFDKGNFLFLLIDWVTFLSLYHKMARRYYHDIVNKCFD